MRILQIRFKNLNSLVGEWHIDLSHPAFVEDGIFAITGPTGAGKSTILDAICLALYGRTPRLGKITKTSNDIMSRQRGECFAEVTFETSQGRFRCHWSQHRARKRPDGELQPPRQEIANADTGEILTTRLKGVAEQIEETTGMDFERFTRSMLLAQGDFASFLQAGADERAPILEQITGTAIYSQISMAVHERNAEEQARLKALEEQMAFLQLLKPKEEAALKQGLEEANSQEQALAAAHKQLEMAIAWLEAIARLKQELANLVQESEGLEAEIQASTPESERLDRAQVAATLAGPFASLSAIRAQNQQDTAALETLKLRLPELEQLAQQGLDALQQAEARLGAAKAALQESQPRLRQVRVLDQALADQGAAMQKLSAECQQDQHEIDRNQGQRQEAVELLHRQQQDLALTTGYLHDHAGDARLVSELAAIEAESQGLLKAEQLLTQNAGEITRAVQSQKQAATATARQEQLTQARHSALEQARQHLQQGISSLEQILNGRLLREYQAEKDGLLRELALVNRIVQLEDQRAQLEDGRPCPLCGAREHPFAQGNAPKPDELEARIHQLEQHIEQAQTAEANIAALTQLERQAEAALAQAQQHQAQAQAELRLADQTLQSHQQQQANLSAEAAQQEAAFHERLLSLGIRAAEGTDKAKLMASLRQRLQAWQGALAQKTTTEHSILTTQAEISRLDAIIKTQQEALDRRLQQHKELQRSCEQKQQERTALFGTGNPDEEEQALTQRIQACETAAKAAGTGQQARQQELASTRVQIQSLTTAIEGRQPATQRLETAFATALTGLGFENEAAFLAAKLAPEAMADIRGRMDALRNRQMALETKRQDRHQSLAAEQAKAMSDQPLEILRPQLEEGARQLQDINSQRAELRLRLATNAKARTERQERQAAMDAQRNECQRWGRLHSLIGSADGKKYRNFAQGLTFEIMVAHANQQLRRMYDRYLLVRNPQQPLELLVMDNYQAGEMRTTKNLSGGESFIISLALALGLSQMASRSVRVDSLFLDEGFGTLDEDALDTALETLASLHQEGKLIGIISHVPALKERISCQIEVIPGTGGTSRISGPGCNGL